MKLHLMSFDGWILLWNYEPKITLLQMLLGPFLGDKIDSEGAVRMSTRMVFHIPKASKQSLCMAVMTTELETKDKGNIYEFPRGSLGA